MSSNNFDRLAPIYDALALFIFGRNLIKASVQLLDCIDPGSEVLIIGGGTGAFLKGREPDFKITYLERSAPMIKKARGNIPAKVTFVQQDFFDLDSPQKFDTIVCPFFLDVFNPNNLNQVISRFDTLLKPDGKLLVSDFQRNGRRTGELLLWLMHAFFRVAASLESRSLQPIHEQIKKAGYTCIRENFFYHQLIFSRIYQRRETFPL